MPDDHRTSPSSELAPFAPRIVRLSRRGSELLAGGRPLRCALQVDASVLDDAAERGHEVLAFFDACTGAAVVIAVLRPDFPSPRAPERLELEASRRLELRCGEARLVMTEDGKILLQGAHLSSHATGLNRLTGAIVAIN